MQWVSFGRKLIQESIYSLPSARLQVDIRKSKTQNRQALKPYKKSLPVGPTHDPPASLKPEKKPHGED